MIATTLSSIPLGYENRLVKVEGDSNRGLPAFNIVGMANKTITESKERVRSAIVNSGFSFPDKKITINLAPANLHKDGAHLDLPIAISILILSNQLLQSEIDHSLFAGELSLSGEVRPIPGIINIIESAKSAHISTVYLPIDNLAQASLIQGVELVGVKNLTELFLHLKKQRPISLPKIVVKNTKTDKNLMFIDHIRGQTFAKRALTIAIAGHHNILISGPPGSGKTLLARTALNLLPPPSSAEQISITKLHSLAGLANDEVIHHRPFRTPHHTSSLTSIIGGGSRALPGEISLAHHGVLFLDELPEYPRSTLESLRQPLEDKSISIARVNHKVTYPADFMLIATMNPCPCGFLGDPTHECTCTPHQISSYQKKLSGPLLDRIDLYFSVQKVANSDLLRTTSPSPNSPHPEHDVVKNNITEALSRQFARFHSSITYNASLSSHQISSTIQLTPDAQELLATASNKLNLSARSYFKTIKVARTIADLAGSDLVESEHISEALSYRQKELPYC